MLTYSNEAVMEEINCMSLKGPPDRVSCKTTDKRRNLVESKLGSKGEDFALVSGWGLCTGGLGHCGSVSPHQTWSISPDY